MTPLAAHASSPSCAAASSQKTAPVYEFHCTFTHDVRRKNSKRWKDGYLKHHTFNNRLLVYDETRNFVQSGHQTSTIGDICDGAEFSLDVILVQVGEQMGSTHTDLSEVVKRKSPKGVTSSPKHRRLLGSPSLTTRNSAPLRSIIGAKGTLTGQDQPRHEGYDGTLLRERTSKRPRTDTNHKPLVQILNAGDQPRPGSLVLAALQHSHKAVQPLNSQSRHEMLSNRRPRQFVDLTDTPKSSHASSCPTTTSCRLDATLTSGKTPCSASLGRGVGGCEVSDARVSSRSRGQKVVLQNKESTVHGAELRQPDPPKSPSGLPTQGPSERRKKNHPLSKQPKKHQASHKQRMPDRRTSSDPDVLYEDDESTPAVYTSLQQTASQRPRVLPPQMTFSEAMPRVNNRSSEPAVVNGSISKDVSPAQAAASSQCIIPSEESLNRPTRSLKLKSRPRKMMLCQNLNDPIQPLHQALSSLETNVVPIGNKVAEGEDGPMNPPTNTETIPQDDVGSLFFPESPPHDSELAGNVVRQPEASSQSQGHEIVQERCSPQQEQTKSPDHVPSTAHSADTTSPQDESAPRPERVAKRAVLKDMHTIHPVTTSAYKPVDSAPTISGVSTSPDHTMAARCKGLPRSLSNTVEILPFQRSAGSIPTTDATAIAATHRELPLQRHETIGHAAELAPQSDLNQGLPIDVCKPKESNASKTTPEQGAWTRDAWDLFGECPVDKKAVLNWEYDEAVTCAD